MYPNIKRFIGRFGGSNQDSVRAYYKLREYFRREGVVKGAEFKNVKYDHPLKEKLHTELEITAGRYAAGDIGIEEFFEIIEKSIEPLRRQIFGDVLKEKDYWYRSFQTKPGLLQKLISRHAS